jgi:hypothetical protein
VLPEDLVAVLERELLLLPVRVRLEALVAAADLVQRWADLVADHEKLLGPPRARARRAPGVTGHERWSRGTPACTATGPGHADPEPPARRRRCNSAVPPASLGSAMSPGRAALADVLVDGAVVRVMEVGDPAADPLLFLHGWGLSPGCYADGMPRSPRPACGSSRRACPGFGGSDAPPLLGHRPAAYAERIGRLLDVLG